MKKFSLFARIFVSHFFEPFLELLALVPMQFVIKEWNYYVLDLREFSNYKHCLAAMVWFPG